MSYAMQIGYDVYHWYMNLVYLGLFVCCCMLMVILHVYQHVGYFDLLGSNHLWYLLGHQRGYPQTCRYEGQIYFHWYKILGLLYKRALFDLQFVHNLF
jgi:hypothetical protein